MLRPGSSLVPTTTNLASLGSRRMLLLGLSPYVDTALRNDQAGHVRYYVLESLSSLLRENQLRVDKVQRDFLNFSNDGLGSAKLAHLFPKFGRSLIIRAIAQERAGEPTLEGHT